MAARWRGGRAFDRYERSARVPVTAVQLLLVPIVLVPILFDPPTWLSDLIDVLGLAFWVVFTIDYLIRMALTPTPGRYFVTHLLDLLLIVLWTLPIFTIPRSGAFLRATVGLRLLPLVASGTQHAWGIVHRVGPSAAR